MRTELLVIAELLPTHINPATREGILFIEEQLKARAFPDLNVFSDTEMEEFFSLTHRFADGVYARELCLPKETIVVGKIHRYGHLNIITKGRCLVVTEFGVEEIVAPCTFTSRPGTKRVVLALEDTVWTTLHGVSPEEYDDVEAIESRIICKTFEEFDLLQSDDAAKTPANLLTSV